eukprot:comp11694_c0_seq1/m.6240 comp11694_c0_seq1/g.6240  ORF comp11694_c0_seq1/g.6240 comp11694_c0_seq1/m.6240 type:complete len:191 (-) comp11694_c0_seq1:626-1198(-)
MDAAKQTGNGPSPAPNRDGWLVGTTVALELETNEKVFGEIFAFEPAAKMLVIKEVKHHGDNTHPHTKGKFRIIRQELIKTFKYEGGVGHYPGPLPRVDLDKLREKERRRLQESKVAASKLNPNASPDAQALFNRISRTHPCRWHGINMVVLESVVIQEPYKPENVHSEDKVVQARIQKVVEIERSKLGLA